jgi:AraC-like DNA-binding protein
MVFSFKNTLINTIQNNQQLVCLPNSFVYGQINEFKDLYVENEASFIIVVFQPFGINRLLGIPAHDIKGRIICTEEIFGRQGLILQEKLAEHPDSDTRVQLLNTFFFGLSFKYPKTNHVIIEASIDFILKNRGAITIGQLVKHTGYTERQIERTFSECIGLTPKKFGNIVQLHSFLKMLRNLSKQNNLTNFCYEAGYADQSHLIKVFKKYTGITPTQYLNDTRKLAINFVELNVSQ